MERYITEHREDLVVAGTLLWTAPSAASELVRHGQLAHPASIDASVFGVVCRDEREKIDDSDVGR